LRATCIPHPKVSRDDNPQSERVQGDALRNRQPKHAGSTGTFRRVISCLVAVSLAPGIAGASPTSQSRRGTDLALPDPLRRPGRSTTALALAAAAQKSNILFIMGDDIGWMQPSIYHRGLMVGETPNIDRIGNEATLFRGAIRDLSGPTVPRAPRRFSREPHGIALQFAGNAPGSCAAGLYTMA
jgi:hypothetical protein